MIALARRSEESRDDPFRAEDAGAQSLATILQNTKHCLGVRKVRDCALALLCVEQSGVKKFEGRGERRGEHCVAHLTKIARLLHLIDSHGEGFADAIN